MPSSRNLHHGAFWLLTYLANRVLMMVPTLFGVALLVFFLLRVVPGDIVEVKLRGDGGVVSSETLEFERKRMGLEPKVTPAVVLWDAATSRAIPIGYGVMSADELQDRIFLLTSKEAGRDY